MVELFFNRIILRIQHMTPDCTRQRVPMFFFQRRVTRKTTSSRATETCAYIAKKTKTNPRVKASKSDRCWRGGLYLTVYNSELCSETKRQSCHSPADFVDDFVSWNTDYCQREMCVHVHYNELVSCNVWTMFYRLWIFIREFNHHVVYPIGLFNFFFFISLYMCIILVFRVCTWILNVNYFTFWFSPRLHGIIRELWYRHDYFSSFMLIILFERLSSLLFAWIILSQLWNTQRNYVLSEKFISLNFVRIFYLNWEYWSFHADWQSCITCSSCGAQPNFLILKQEWSIFTVYYIIEIDYLIILYKF